MKELADGVWHIKCLPGLPWAVNAYLAGDVLIDAGCRQSTSRILKQLDGHEVTAHALTHAHPDHQGASRDVCEKLGIPFWCPELDVPAAEDPKLIDERQPDKFMAHFFWRIFHGPGHKVDRVIKEGDEVGRLPGYRRARPLRRTRRLLAGVRPGPDPRRRPGQHGPVHGDPGPARAQARPDARPDAKPGVGPPLAALEPELVCFGHGAPLRDPQKLKEFVDGL